jgi:hypothetical protein
VLPYSRRCSAVETQQKCHLRVVVEPRADGHGAVLIVEGDLPHPVHADEDEGECIPEPFAGLDWAIERVAENGQNLTDSEATHMVVALNKATPMSGMTLWWKQPFVDAPEISLETFASGSADGASSFAEAWEEAHRQFRERVQNRQALSDAS